MEAEEDDQAAEHTDDPLDGFDAERILARTQGRAGLAARGSPPVGAGERRTARSHPRDPRSEPGRGSLPGSPRQPGCGETARATGPTRHPGSSGGARGGWVGRRSRTRRRRFRRAR